MGAGDETSWFQSAQVGNMTGLRGKHFCGKIDENPSSRYRGFAAIHYAAYFGKTEALEFLQEDESAQLTGYPVVLNVPSRERAFTFPAGLSYQCLLALQGKFGTLRKMVKAHGVVKSPVPLASCMAFACGLRASRQIQEELMTDLAGAHTSSSPLANPLEVAMCCGYVEYAEYLLRAASSQKYACIAKTLEFDFAHLHRDLYIMTASLRPSMRQMEDVKDLIRRYRKFGLQPEPEMGCRPRPQLSIRSYSV